MNGEASRSKQTALTLHVSPSLGKEIQFFIQHTNLEMKNPLGAIELFGKV